LLEALALVEAHLHNLGQPVLRRLAQRLEEGNALEEARDDVPHDLPLDVRAHVRAPHLQVVELEQEQHRLLNRRRR